MIRILPREAVKRPLPHTMLVHGALTGHSDRVGDPATLFAGDVCFSLDMCGDQALVVHDEHGTIAPARGVCRVWRQRKTTPQRIVAVQDWTPVSPRPAPASHEPVRRMLRPYDGLAAAVAAAVLDLSATPFRSSPTRRPHPDRLP